MNKEALLLVDFQMDYFENGNMELPHANEAIENAKRALISARRREIPVYHIVQESIHQGATFLLPNTKGMEIHANVTPIENENIYKKHFPNSFRGTDLLNDLKSQEITELTIIGMMTNTCVDSTVRAAFDHEFTVTLLEDSCAAQKVHTESIEIPAEIVHKSFAYWLKMGFASVITTNEWIDSPQNQ